MKKLLLITLFLFSFVYADSLQVYSAFFGVYGNYSDGVNSKAGSGYVTLGLNYRHHLTVGYDYLYKDGGSWSYKQQTGTLGSTLNFDPFYIKASYGHINGKYEDTTSYTSTDYLNIYSGELLFRTGALYLGAGANYVNLNGFENRDIYQAIGRIDYYYGYIWYLSVRPTYTSVRTTNAVGSVMGKNKRDLFSVGFKFNHLITTGWVGKIGGSFGKRAYYYDNELFTIYNQDETQEMMLSAGIDWYPNWNTVVNVGFQYNKFDGYEVNYLIAGVKFSW